MKDIKVILEAFELDDDMRNSIIEEVNANYRTIEETEKRRKRIEELEEQNKTLSDQVGKLEGDGEELEKLRKQVQDFTDAEEQRKADEAESAKRASFRTVFDAAVGDKEFANDIVRDSIFDKVYAKCNEQVGIKAEDVIKELTENADGIWKNPQNDVNKMPTPEQISSKKNTGEDAAKREIANFLFPKKE